jgi:hypothetical protein
LKRERINGGKRREGVREKTAEGRPQREDRRGKTAERKTAERKTAERKTAERRRREKGRHTHAEK